MTPLTPEFIQAKNILKSHLVLGGGGQAPGYITLRQWDKQWVTHFYNAQDGGFYYGRYWNRLSDAESNFESRVEAYVQQRANSFTINA